MKTSLLLPSASHSKMQLISDAPAETQVRFLEFFAANIRNPNTHKAYARATADFMNWRAKSPGEPRPPPQP